MAIDGNCASVHGSFGLFELVKTVKTQLQNPTVLIGIA